MILIFLSAFLSAFFKYSSSNEISEVCTQPFEHLNVLVFFDKLSNFRNFFVNLTHERIINQLGNICGEMNFRIGHRASFQYFIR